MDGEGCMLVWLFQHLHKQQIVFVPQLDVGEKQIVSS